MKKLSYLIVICVCFFSAGEILAAENEEVAVASEIEAAQEVTAPTEDEAQARAIQQLQLTVGELEVVPVEEAHRVAIGDPEIADVNVLSNKEILLIPKSPGRTILIIWDKKGRRFISVVVRTRGEEELASQVAQIKRLLKLLGIPGIRIKVEGEKVFLSGEVAREADLASIEKAIAPFKTVTSLVRLRERLPVVRIDVDVLEVGREELRNLGMDWTPQLPLQYTESVDTEGKFPKLWNVFKWPRDTLEARLNFLIEEDKARSLANPSLVTVSGKEAEILVGGEIPVVTVETEGRTTVEWKPYGVILKIKPTVTSRPQELNIMVTTEVSELDWANAAQFLGTDVPATKKRQAQTELYLRDGETLIIAGLIKNEESRNIHRLPFLSSIPALGELFKSTRFQSGDTELVFALTPTILEQEEFFEEVDVATLAEELEEGAQDKLTVLKRLERQISRKEREAIRRRKELEFQQLTEKEKIKKFEQTISLLRREKSAVEEKIEQLSEQLRLLEQDEEKIKQEKEKLTAYREAEEAKLKKLEQIKELRQEIQELIRQTEGPLPLSLPEEPPLLPPPKSEALSEEEIQQELSRLKALEEELARLKNIREELRRIKEEREGLSPLPIQRKTREIKKALREIEAQGAEEE